MFWQTVDWIGEKQIVIRLKHEIVGTIKPLSLVVVGARSLAAVFREHRNPPIAMLALRQPTFGIECVGIRPRLAPIVDQAGVPRRFHVKRYTLAILPLH